MSDFRVSSLIMDIGWNQVLIEEMFWPVDKESILSIPLSARRREDCLIWHFDSRGVYYVKSGHKVEMEERAVACGTGHNSEEIWMQSAIGGILKRFKGGLVSAGRFDEPKEVVVRARRLLGDFLVCGLDEIAKPKQVVSKHKWKKHRCVKLNVDVAIDDALGFIGIGVVARDDRGV
ncbi:hypothetical protein TIFTF001_052871, partial [Ficus carica]